MKILKKVLLAILIIVAIPFVIALFVKNDYAIEREVVISKPKQEVFDYVKFLKNQDNFSKWASMDSNMEKSFRGIDGTVGFVSAWASEDDDVGVGEQEITSIADGERIEYELRFIKPFEATDQAYMTTESVSENETLVKWGFTGRMNYPMNLMLLFMDFEEMIGDDLQTGLLNLKNILENSSLNE
ncbi:MAG: SRPBCC family protein [Bacteroidales bacterium]|nr:SRPBCC family protein [Bacteroidales bacterium]